MTAPVTFDQRINDLEKAYGCDTTPGTQLIRTLGTGGVFGWGLGIGKMSMPKPQFNASTIDGVLTLAEEAVKPKGKRKPKAKPVAGMIPPGSKVVYKDASHSKTTKEGYIDGAILDSDEKGRAIWSYQIDGILWFYPRHIVKVLEGPTVESLQAILKRTLSLYDSEEETDDD